MIYEKMSANNQARTHKASPVTAIVLAAGLSRRMGKANKLLQEIDGRPMIRRVVQQVLEAPFEQVIVVLGYEWEAVDQALGNLPVERVVNRQFEEGLGASVRAGIAAVRPGHAAVICLGDMPEVSATELSALIHAYNEEPSYMAYRPYFQGKPGNPVLWSPPCLVLLGQLKGDEGARHLLQEQAHEVLPVTVDNDGVLLDIDTPEQLAAFNVLGGRPKLT